MHVEVPKKTDQTMFERNSFQAKMFFAPGNET
jgi:hypothetical protein